MLSEDEMRRLTFIKYLYSLGMEQSRQAQPHASAAILTLHDAVELFLHLATEHHKVEIGKKPLDFADYFGRLEVDPPGLTLIGKQSMLRLNQARVGLKHHANLPDKVTITDLTGRVGIFFDDNSLALFGIDFGQISLVGLVTAPDVKVSLEEAVSAKGAGNLAEAIKKVKLAFAQLTTGYRERAGGYKSAYWFGSYIRAASLEPPPTRMLLESVEALKHAMEIVSLGLDYPRYAYFDAHTPHAFQNLGGDFTVSDPKVEDCTGENYERCLGFVIECALKLQESDAGHTQLAHER